jgi:hypothetical protein
MESNKNVYKILFIVTLLYMLVFKPTGIISAGFIMVYIVINLHGKTMIDFIKKHRLALGAFVTAAVAAGAYLYMGGMLDPLISSMQFNAKKVLYNIYAKGD